MLFWQLVFQMESKVLSFLAMVEVEGHPVPVGVEVEELPVEVMGEVVEPMKMEVEVVEVHPSVVMEVVEVHSFEVKGEQMGHFAVLMKPLVLFLVQLEYSCLELEVLEEQMILERVVHEELLNQELVVLMGPVVLAVLVVLLSLEWAEEQHLEHWYVS